MIEKKYTPKNSDMEAVELLTNMPFGAARNQFLRDLKKSVERRQSLNKSLGVDPGHATRVAQESRLIKVVTKILSGS